MVHPDRGSVHVVSHGDQDPVMLWAVDVVENSVAEDGRQS
jgi:hypothetical protein